MTPGDDDLHRARLLWDYLRPGGTRGLPAGGRRARPRGSRARRGPVPRRDRAADRRVRRVPGGAGRQRLPTEADAIVDVLLRRDVPKDAIALERLASNTSENFWLSAELLRDLAQDPDGNDGNGAEDDTDDHEEAA